MGDYFCYVCDAKLGFGNRWQIKALENANAPIPDGMTDKDRICISCLEIQKKMAKGDDAGVERWEAERDLQNRTKDYKPKWNKDGTIQYKDENCAILKRSIGSQVQFIIAYSDLTKEGYRLMAIDEGKTAGGGSIDISGGVSSYYYFQKIELVR